MRSKEKLQQIQSVAALLFDLRLSRLEAAARAKAESLERLAGLEVPVVANADLQGAAAELSALNYQRWADARRAEITLTLARQTAEWMEARDAARHAFGRAEALRGLLARR